MTTMPLTDLLLRDPKHPEVRALLMARYEQVCREKALLQKVLELREQTRREKRDEDEQTLIATR